MVDGCICVVMMCVVLEFVCELLVYDVCFEGIVENMLLCDLLFWVVLVLVLFGLWSLMGWCLVG